MQVHRRMGERLEQGYSTQVGDVAAQLAVHFERGGEVQRAIHYWQQTGDNAVRRNAHSEAIAALRKGLALLSTLPDSRGRTQRELALQLTLGELLTATQGMASPAAEKPIAGLTRSASRWGKRHSSSERSAASLRFIAPRRSCTPERAFGQQFFDLAQRQRDPVLVREGHMLLGTAALDYGDPVAARIHLEQSLDLSAAQRLRQSLSATGLHPQVESLAKLMRSPVALGLCGPGPAAQPRSPGARPARRAYPESGVCGSTLSPRSPSAAGTRWPRMRRPTR